ncbi:MAG: orotidine-5'-phosphate decarboxylase [Spirochaetota bacterium]|nr:orotidine-5'-phosphate decarboxylase [Spirochaetota bacterium]
MNYLELLKFSSNKFNSIISLGLDPILEDIPISSGTIKKRIVSFFESILNRMTTKGVYPAAVKPNYAFYAQYGIEGIEALLSIIAIFKSQGFPVILDVKRGDIGKTSVAYSKEAFDFFKADALTISPFMGHDSIYPFIQNHPDKGYYILNKTSNKGSEDFQDLSIDGIPLYIYISKKIIEWHQPGIGAVVGATYPDKLELIIDTFIHSAKAIPLLIPGVGSQGGDVKMTLRAIKRLPDVKIHRINSSSSITYAYKKYQGLHFSEAAVCALEALNEEIHKYI